MRYLVPPAISLQQDQGHLSLPLPTLSPLSVPKCGQVRVSGGVGGNLIYEHNNQPLLGKHLHGAKQLQNTRDVVALCVSLASALRGIQLLREPQENRQVPLPAFPLCHCISSTLLLSAPCFHAVFTFFLLLSPGQSDCIHLPVLRYSFISRDKEAQVDAAPFPDLCCLHPLS